jgi:hypothetical protein
MLGNSRRARRVVAALAVTAAIAGGVQQAAADEAEVGVPEGSASLVSVTSEVGPSTETCASGLFARLALTRDVIDTPERFSLVVHVARPLCTPISAKAAVYAMPGGANAWPQTLVEAVPFEVGQVGTVTISFEKACRDLQFDVIEGATPQEISPIGQWHGPLLFAGDTATALQWFGTASDDCDEDSTSTTTPTVTPRSGGDDTTTTTTTTSTTVAVPTPADRPDSAVLAASTGSSVGAASGSAAVGSASVAKLAFTG